jgi:hypothetical protein
MKPIDNIKQILKDRNIQISSCDDESLTILPNSENGFEVNFYEHGESFTVGFAGWHDTFENFEDALECFTLGLSNNCRLLVTSRGTVSYHWRVETLSNNVWSRYSILGDIIPIPFWKRKKIRILQNNYISN